MPASRSSTLFRPVASLVLALLMVGGGAALAFKPSGSYPDTLTHRDITEKAIKYLITEEEIIPGVTEISCSMEKAIDKIKWGVADGDLIRANYCNAAVHFTNEHFVGGQAWIDDHIQNTITQLQDNNVSEARQSFGLALHALQDFYAHSNWVELGWHTIHPYVGDIGATGSLVASAAGPHEPTCVNCPPGDCPCLGNVSTPKLTTAYHTDFQGVCEANPTPKPEGKCSHGGFGDTSVTIPGTGGINKDTALCFWSPHTLYHQSAARLAVEHTKHVLRTLQTHVTPKQFRALLGAGTSLAFAVDTTGSMGQEIAGVREQALEIVTSRLGTELEPLEYVLVEVNDPRTAVLADTDDEEVFISAIQTLHASGGGDCPELQQTGLLKALNAMDFGGELIIFTDASARDDQLAPNVRALAREKDIRISTAASGSCSPIDPEYYRTATDTGGQVFVISRSEADNLTPLVDFLARPNTVDVLAVSDTLTGAAKTYSVPVDPTMRRVTFSISGTPNAVLRRPDGSAVQPTDTGVQAVLLGLGRIFSVASPPAGTWELTVQGSGELSVRISGESPMNLSAFDFVEKAGGPSHEGHAPIAGLPLATQASKVEAQLVGEPGSTAEFELRAANGSLVRALNLAETPRPVEGLSRTFFSEIETPNVPFLVYVKGVDADGNPYQRLRPGVIKPQTVKLNTPPLPSLHANEPATYMFQIQNLGPAATFRLAATDDRGFVVSIVPSSITLDAGQTGEATVNLFVPAATENRTPVSLTLSARNVSDPDAGNFAIVTGLVTTNRPPDVSQARSSLSTLWPPNHDLVAVGVQGITDPDGDPVTIRVLRVQQDEPTNGQGDGNHCPDATGVGSGAVQLRAERSGKGNGRVYTVFFEATDGRGGSTPGSVRVSVPHEQDGHAVDDGPSFDATLCP